jgi:hypothetical protein
VWLIVQTPVAIAISAPGVIAATGIVQSPALSDLAPLVNINASATVQAPTVVATAPVSTIGAIAAIETPSYTATASGAINATASIGIPQIIASATSSPSTIVATSTVGAPTAIALATPSTIGATTIFGEISISATAVMPAEIILAIAAVQASHPAVDAYPSAVECIATIGNIGIFRHTDKTRIFTRTSNFSHNARRPQGTIVASALQASVENRSNSAQIQRRVTALIQTSHPAVHTYPSSVEGVVTVGNSGNSGTPHHSNSSRISNRTSNVTHNARTSQGTTVSQLPETSIENRDDSTQLERRTPNIEIED